MRKIISVCGMSCEHCVKRVTNAINEIEGAKCINVSLDDNTVEVEITDESILNSVEEAIADAGYDVVK